MSNILGAAIGAAIDRRDGDSGIKGLVVGALTQRVLITALPIIASVAVAWYLKRLFSSESSQSTSEADADQKSGKGSSKMKSATA